MVAKGRHGRNGLFGESSPVAKLTDADVVKIRELHAQGVSQAEIGRRLEIPASTISAIVLRRSWKHIP